MTREHSVLGRVLGTGAGPVWLLAAFLVASGCRDGESPALETPTTAAPGKTAGGEAEKPAKKPNPVPRLLEFEEERRAATDFASLAPGDRVTGPNPYDVVALPARAPGGEASNARFVGILRGADALVLLDGEGKELARIDAPRSPTGLAIGSGKDGATVHVSGEGSATIARYRVKGDGLQRTGEIVIPDALAITDIALGPEGVLHVIEEFEGRLLTVPLAGGEARESARCLGPMQVLRHGDLVLVDCLLDRAVLGFRVDRRGVPGPEPVFRIQHDGPIWSMAAASAAGRDELVIALGGVEDHALDRSDGSFGYIDSFLFMYSVAGDGEPQRWAEVNVAERGLVTPKWLAVEVAPGGAVAVDMTGYGSGQRLGLSWAKPGGPVSVSASELPPGTTAVARGDAATLIANPLLDGWISVPAQSQGNAASGAAASPATPHLVAVQEAPGARPRTPESRVGEALFFTTLMAPWNPSDEHLSRFTCETCHFEAYVDGRIHFTGRGKVHATTKPLRGLFNNRPHFSRALDRTMAAMVHAEFRVANKGSERDPWFTLQRAGFSWLEHLGEVPETLSPMYLRRALMSFLMELTHRANPAVAGRSEWSERERAGAVVFRDRCEHCHSARLIADVDESRVPFEKWQSLVLAPEGAIVWGRVGYFKTGVEPYVHDDGARTPSLRRLYKKRPYFTNGTAADLRAVLERARFRIDDSGEVTTFFHDSAPEGLEALGEGEIVGLLAFLRLL